MAETLQLYKKLTSNTMDCNRALNRALRVHRVRQVVAKLAVLSTTLNSDAELCHSYAFARKPWASSYRVDPFQGKCCC